MINFYYCPIRGLRYSYLEELYFIDISVIPQNLTVEELLKIWKQQTNLYGVDFLGNVEIIGMITNYIDI